VQLNKSQYLLNQWTTYKLTLFSHNTKRSHSIKDILKVAFSSEELLLILSCDFFTDRNFIAKQSFTLYMWNVVSISLQKFNNIKINDSKNLS